MTLRLWRNAGVGLLGLGLLTACSGNGPSNLKVHEVNLYGGSSERLAWVYGTLGSSASSTVKMDGVTLELRPQVADSLATPGSLSVNGMGLYRSAGTAAPQKLNLVQSGGLFTATPLNGASIAAIYYTDGSRWSKLSSTSGSAFATLSSGLRGAGQLTDAEADALANALQRQGPLAVAVLNESPSKLKVEPAASEHRQTSLYLLPLTTTPVPNPTSVTTTSMTPTSPHLTSPSGRLPFTTLASGTNAAVDGAIVQVASSASELRGLYAAAYGRQTNAPAIPSLTPNQTVVGLFIGQRSSGGYGIRVLDAAAAGGALTLTVELTGPKEGSITTMALTSPWTMVSVPGTFSSVNVVDASGKVVLP